MPVFSSAPALEVFEIHQNRISSIEDDYFTKLPGLKRFIASNNSITALPSSLCACAVLEQVQVHENQLASLPTGMPWPSTLVTLFIQARTSAQHAQPPTLTPNPDPYPRGALLPLRVRRREGGGVWVLVSHRFFIHSRSDAATCLRHPTLARRRRVTELRDGPCAQGNPGLTALPPELAKCSNMLRCNVSRLPIDGASGGTVDALQKICIGKKGGAFWDLSGTKHDG
eukprot:7274807-Prymnesium_polylepis.1